MGYLKQGMSVIPVLPRDKRPAQQWKQFQDRYADDDEVARWWEQWPDANIGIVTGSISGISVIDVDGQAGLDSINEHQIRPPTTRVIKTPKGWHLYYQYREDWHTGAGFLPGIDVRNDGGYVVAPPSQINGNAYEVLRDLPVAAITLPITAFQKHSRAVAGTPEEREARPNWVSDAIEHGASQPGRNDTATRLVGYFHSLGTPKDIIEVLLADFGGRCNPPMDMRELRSTIDSVTRYQMKVHAARIGEPPQFTNEGDALLYTWAEHAVSIRFSNMDNGKDGIHSEIMVEAGPPGIPPIVYGPARFNLVSTTARTALVKYMTERYSLDWAGILESASRLAVMETREGEPILDLRDHTATESKWLLYPFVLEDQPTFLFADGGTGKSLFGLAMLLSIQLDLPIMGRVPSAPVKGLYLDWEATPGEHVERYRHLLAANDVDSSTVSLLYRRCDSPLVEQVPQLRRFIVENGIGFAVIDSVVAACNGEAEHSDTARQFFNALRKLKIPTLNISHTTKEKDTSHKPFGSTFWNNLARNTWEMRKSQEDGEDTVHLAMWNRKINAGRKHKPIGYTVRFTDKSISIRAGDVMQVPDFAAEEPLWKQALSVLSGREMTAKDIAEELNKPSGLVRKELNIHKDTFEHASEGREPLWKIKEKNE